MEINGYPKVYNLGHAQLKDLFKGTVLVEEKVDGSQFSFGKLNGELRCRSKGKQLVLESPEKLFNKAVETAYKLLPKLKEGWVYRGEYLQTTNHNALTYTRIPLQHVIIFDICPSIETYLPYDEKVREAERLGLETVPKIYEGDITGVADILKLLDTVSILGGQKIEGMVFKNYHQYGVDKKVLMGKHVSEAFKEVHRKNWKDKNPTPKDIINLIATQYTTPARWNKAITHLKERGELTQTPKDIGNLIKEVKQDVMDEEMDAIKEQLFKWAKGHIERQLVKGLPEWYKNKLMEQQFTEEKKE